MQLEAYWGVGPKTKATLEATIGADAASGAIESGDVWRLVDAGVQQSRATRICRRAQSAEGMELLATRDARAVYKDVIELAAEHAVSRDAAGRIRTLTPLTDLEAIRERLDRVETGRATWRGLSDDERAAILDAFDEYDAADTGRLAAVETAVALLEVDAPGAAFEPVSSLDGERLADAASALDALDSGRVGEGADDELDRLRDARDAVETLSANASSLVEELRSEGVQDTATFREGFVERLQTETSVDSSRIREAMATDAVDATGFVHETLRTLRRSLDETIEQRATEVGTALEEAIEEAGDDVDRARPAVARVARDLSLGRFADAYDLTPAAYVEGDVLAVEKASNLSLLATAGDVQPITYALGEHDRTALDVPTGDRVTVLTGANSGGKTTLLETLCQVVILAHMGLPVPAERAQVSLFDRIVFHRRHASFNAGVLESTLQSVVPPLVSGERTLMLVDEFEAITEPGRAADLLHGLVQLTVNEGALGTFVTHLADDLEPLPDAARTDGIFAEGLTNDLELKVDYQPRFGEVGRSTPEFIVSRLVANAGDRAEEAGFRTLAAAVGTDVVQRTLSDVEWRGVDSA